MNYIILSNFIVLGLLTYLGMFSLEYRFSENYKKFLIYMIFVLIMSLINFNGASSLKAIFIIFIMILYVISMFKGSFFNILILLLPYYISVTISEIFTISILSMFTNFSEYTKPESVDYLIALCISNSLAFLFCRLYIRLKKILNTAHLPQYTWFIFILPITTIFFIVSIQDYYEVVRNNLSSLIILIGLFFSNLIIIYIFFKVTEYINLKKDMDILKYKEQSIETKYNLIDQQYKFNFNFLHNLLNSCNNLNNSFQNQNYDRLRQEISELSDEVYRNFHSFYSNSVVLNAVLSSQLGEINVRNTVWKKQGKVPFLGLFSCFKNPKFRS